MSEAATSVSPTEWFQPSWRRLGIAALVALAAFFVPQGVPFEWYPLNHPGSDILYLEMTCASDKTGEVQIFYNTAEGINELESIHLPIAPTTQPYTYSFPLPDAPIVELRIDPVADGGTLAIQQMRITNRRGAEIRRFTARMFHPLNQIAAISPTPDGWTITSTPNSTDPFARIDLPSPLLPLGLKGRLLQRCVLSTGYLALMIWILLLAVLFAAYRPKSTAEFVRHVAFMAALALMFAVVGNRGLLRNSFRHASYAPSAVVSSELNLEIDLSTSSPDTPAQLFWNTGAGLREEDSARCVYEPHRNLQTLRFPLPHKTIEALRFDPQDGESTLVIRGIRVVDAAQRTVALLPLDSFQAVQQIASLTVESDRINLVTAPAGRDPILHFTSGSVATVNGVLTAPKSPSPP